MQFVFFAAAALILILIKILYYLEHKSQNHKIRFSLMNKAGKQF